MPSNIDSIALTTLTGIARKMTNSWLLQWFPVSRLDVNNVTKNSLYATTSHENKGLPCPSQAIEEWLFVRISVKVTMALTDARHVLYKTIMALDTMQLFRFASTHPFEPQLSGKAKVFEPIPIVKKQQVSTLTTSTASPSRRDGFSSHLPSRPALPTLPSRQQSFWTIRCHSQAVAKEGPQIHGHQSQVCPWLASRQLGLSTPDADSAEA